MEPSRPGALPVVEQRRFPVGAVVSGVIIAVIAVWITVAAVNNRSPEGVVEDFLTAVAEKDVAEALELVSRSGYGVPYGAKAAFLTPEAINGDWWVVSTEEVERDYSSARVKAVIAGPGGTADGVFTAREVDDEWMISDPFVRVSFPSSPLSYLQVNDQVVSKTAGRSVYSNDYYALFPGLYRFYQSDPGVVDVREAELVAAFPPLDGSSLNDPKEVLPQDLSAGKEVVAKAQQAVERRIDECTGFATKAPDDGACPFGTDGEIDTADGRRVTDVHSLKWTVEKHPVVGLANKWNAESGAGFPVVAAEPGAVTLTGGGRDTEGNAATFTVTCDIDLTGVLVKVDRDGDVDLSAAASVRRDADKFNTCRRNT